MKLLFVCTGNIFRSMTAEYCLKDYINKHNIQGIEVSSAGTCNIYYEVLPEVIRALKTYNIDVSNHRQTFVTRGLLEKQDLIVAMSKEHQKELEEKHGINSKLYNELCYGVKTSIPDVIDVLPDWEQNRKAAEKYIKSVIKYIYNSTPLLVKNII